jgi:hypothetical protein
MSNIFDLRVKNGRCQILIKIDHHYDEKSETYKTTRTWQDFEKHFANSHVINGSFDYVTVAQALEIDFPEDEVET